MQSTNEIDANISLMEKGYIPEDLKTKLTVRKNNNLPNIVLLANCC